MGIGFLLLDYEDPKSANKVLNKPFFFKGRRLFIQRREYKEPSKEIIIIFSIHFEYHKSQYNFIFTYISIYITIFVK